MISLLAANYKDAVLVFHRNEAVRDKNQQNTHFFITDLIQLYCLRHVSKNQVFLLRKTPTCSCMVFFSCIRIRSLVDVGMCLIPCGRQNN